MNISDIKAKSVYGGTWFRDFEVKMSDLIEEPGIKNWIDNLQTISAPNDLRERLLKESWEGYVRVRFNENSGEIYEMMAHQAGRGSMCCMFYTKPDKWDVLKDMIEGLRRIANE